MGDGSSWEDRITREKYKWGKSGENVMKSFMGSTAHRGNILYEPYKHFGAAWITPENQWVQVFAAARVGVEFCDPIKPTNPPVTIPTRKPTGFTYPPSPPWKLEMLASMNKERSKVKASALCFNYKLTNAAEKHNQDMVENQIWSHTGSDGSSIQDRIGRENYKWGTTGENILRGKGSVALAMEKFIICHF